MERERCGVVLKCEGVLLPHFLSSDGKLAKKKGKNAREKVLVCIVCGAVTIAGPEIKDGK